MKREFLTAPKKNLELLCALIGIARSSDGAAALPPEFYPFLFEAFSKLRDQQPTAEELGQLIRQAHALKHILVPNCASCAAPCGRHDDYDPADLVSAEQAVLEQKQAIYDEIQDDIARNPQPEHWTEDHKLCVLKATFFLGEDLAPEGYEFILGELRACRRTVADLAK